MEAYESRPEAVAGMFYPDAPEALRERVREYLAQAPAGESVPAPRALIAPHAGYIYSGPVAGSAYKALLRSTTQIRRVVLLGPSHYVPFTGLALSHYSAFHTPLGDVPIDDEAIEKIRSLPQVQFLESAHEREHCLEVNLPFLQTALNEFTLVPLVVGNASPGAVAEVLDLLWDEQTLVVVSSDLSHYLDDPAARALDARTCQKIEQFDYTHLQPKEACGAHAIAGLLKAAAERHMSVTTLDLRNSGDTAGSKDHVVGYGAWSFS